MTNYKIEKYKNTDINNPKYLFHGSPYKLDKLVPRKSHDSEGNIINIDNAIFMFPLMEKASAYSFKDTIKKKSEGLAYDFIVPSNNDEKAMYMQNVNIDEDIIGYIYVIEIAPDFIKDYDVIEDENGRKIYTGSLQYRSHREITPIDVIEVRYKDFAKYYEVNTDSRQKRR